MSLRVRSIQKLIALNEDLFFYPRLKKFYAQHLPSASTITVLDVGSNRGQSIDFFMSLNPNARIIGFEPNPDLFSHLVKRFGGNKNITVFPYGVSDIEGTRTLQQNIMNETSSFEDLNYDSAYLKRKARILGVSPKDIIVQSYDTEVISLRSFLQKHPVSNIDVLKIDVEGHELNCLRGLFDVPHKGYPIRFIQLESHQDDMYVNDDPHEEINTLLLANGFELCKRIRHGFGKFFELIYRNTQSA